MNTTKDSFGRSSNDALSLPALKGGVSRAKTMTSYVKVSPQHLMAMIEEKRKTILKEKEKTLEDFIERNIKPERTFLFFFKKKAVTRQDLLNALQENVIDSDGYNQGSCFDIILSEYKIAKDRIEDFLDLIDTAKKSEDKMIRLSISDNHFLTS